MELLALIAGVNSEKGGYMIHERYWKELCKTNLVDDELMKLNWCELDGEYQRLFIRFIDDILVEY
jgi:hypothetical protein